jgi:ATP-dependent DNA helicase RecG
MVFPAWADEGLSRAIPALRKMGEGERLDYKADFPESTDRLGQLVAAMATSGGGTILIGVENNGTVVGLPASTECERDQLLLRTQGIMRGVRPSVKFRLSLASDENRLVLVIEIQASQDYPVFYHDGRPYVRHGSETRRAEPDEVQAKVWSHPSAEFKRESERIELDSRRQLLDYDKALDSRMLGIPTVRFPQS